MKKSYLVVVIFLALLTGVVVLVLRASELPEVVLPGDGREYLRREIKGVLSGDAYEENGSLFVTLTMGSGVFEKDLPVYLAEVGTDSVSMGSIYPAEDNVQSIWGTYEVDRIGELVGKEITVHIDLYNSQKEFEGMLVKRECSNSLSLFCRRFQKLYEYDGGVRALLRAIETDNWPVYLYLVKTRQIILPAWSLSVFKLFEK